MRKPFYIAARKKWFVKTQDGKSKIYLGETEEAAYAAWEAMRLAGASRLDQCTAPLVVARYLEDGLAGGADYQARVEHYLVEFSNQFLNGPQAIELSPKNVSDWIDTKETWGNNSQRDCIVAIKQCWKWAHANGLLSKNNLANMPVPEDTRREVIITPEQHALMCTKCAAKRFKRDGRLRTDGTLRAFLVALKLTGGSPISLRRLTRNGFLFSSCPYATCFFRVVKSFTATSYVF